MSSSWFEGLHATHLSVPEQPRPCFERERKLRCPFVNMPRDGHAVPPGHMALLSMVSFSVRQIICVNKKTFPLITSYILKSKKEK